MYCTNYSNYFEIITLLVTFSTHCSWRYLTFILRNDWFVVRIRELWYVKFSFLNQSKVVRKLWEEFIICTRQHGKYSMIFSFLTVRNMDLLFGSSIIDFNASSVCVGDSCYEPWSGKCKIHRRAVHSDSRSHH